MAIYRSIQMSFWTDAKVVDDFTPEDKYFYLYLFTNPHTNLCGCYEISKAQMNLELGYSKQVIEKLLKRFEKTHDVIRYDEKTKEILLLNWSKYNWTKSSDFRKSLLKEIENIKNQEFRSYLSNIADGVDTVPRPSNDGVGTTVTVTDTVTDTVSIKDDIENGYGFGRKVLESCIIPPKVEWVEQYCKARNNTVDPQQFFDFYESKNWMIGKSKMKDWMACVRTWERNRTEKPKQEHKHQTYNFEELQRMIEE